jgi:hypothetical protein
MQVLPSFLAEAGIQVFRLFWTPAFAGVTLWTRTFTFNA